MRLNLKFVFALCLLVAAVGCNSGSGNSSSQPAAVPPASGQTTAGQSVPASSPQTSGNSAAAVVVPGQTATAPTGATTQATSPAPGIADACALLTSDDIKSVQGEAVQNMKPNRRTDSPLAITQCFYTTPTFTKSVSLEVTERGTSARSVHQFWEENLEHASEDGEREREEEERRHRQQAAGEKKGDTEKEREREREEEREREKKGPRRLKGIGDEAFWISTNANSTLYVFKKDTLVRLSIGGTDTEDGRMKRLKALAQKALARL